MNRTLTIDTNSPHATRRLGAHVGALLEAGDVILLNGTLGAGKTHFTQGVAQGLGITGAVRSPTFTLINEHREGRLPLYHIDLYRTDNNADLATIGLEDYFQEEGVVVIEWAEKGNAWLPDDALMIAITTLDDDHRRFAISANGERAAALLAALETLPSDYA
jgi:tRNA threonylcarbamoyladenosine biosynthesis protein TsaE